MSTFTRRAPLDVRRPHPTLSIGWKRGRNSSNLAGHEQSDDTPEYDGVQLFELALCADRNRWDIARRRGGMFSCAGRLSRSDAEAALRQALTALERGDW